jgi:hypothetical protein
VIRQIRVRARQDDRPGRLAPTAVVFQRPLPYLYLARQLCEDAGVPTQAMDALPLAGEPYAALLDLVLVVARTGGTRESIVGLLRSPMLRFEVAGGRVTMPDVAALDAVLLARRVTGGAERYLDEINRYFGKADRRDRIDAEGARRAGQAAEDAARELVAFPQAETASAQVGTIAAFLRLRQQGPLERDRWRESYLRARAAVLGALDGLAGAYRNHDDHRREADVLVAAIRHEVERQTFSPARQQAGVHLVDAVAARFGEFEHVHLVGLVEAEWPERPRRNIFYTRGLLKALGWPQDADHAAAQLAAFRDLTGLPARTLHLHAFQLENDGVVALSPMVETVRGLPAVFDDTAEPFRIFADEGPEGHPDQNAAMTGEVAGWFNARRQRPPLDDPRYHGVGLPQPPQAYRVSKVDRYVTCPFQYFSESVLGLQQEREEATGLTPIERGTLMHGLFEKFYRAWNAAGHGTITAELLPEAVALFTAMVHEACAELPDADRVLEETRLLGSLVASA